MLVLYPKLGGGFNPLPATARRLDVSSTSCNWCELVSIAADLGGVIGGLLLAWAFFVGKRQRDALTIIEGATNPEPQDAAEFKQAVSDLRREVVDHLRRKYTTIQLGAWMIAGAFFMRFMSAIFS